MELVETDTDISWCDYCEEDVQTQLTLDEKQTPFDETTYTERCCECGRVL